MLDTVVNQIIKQEIQLLHKVDAPEVLAENVILLTYISTIKDTPVAESKQAMRSSIWRLSDGQWRMFFHQGTPLK